MACEVRAVDLSGDFLVSLETFFTNIMVFFRIFFSHFSAGHTEPKPTRLCFSRLGQRSGD